MKAAEYLGDVLERLLARSSQASSEDRERLDKATWDERFAVARSSIPVRFSWVLASCETKHDASRSGKFRLVEPWTSRLPWLNNDHIRRIFELWRADTNLLILGPADIGKTSIMGLHAARTLALAAFDNDEIRAQRDAYVAWTNSGEQRTKPPEDLRVVRRAEGMRWMNATDLLCSNQYTLDAANMATAINAPILYLDELGREMYGATGDGPIATSRRAAVSKVIAARWDDSRKRTIATSGLTLEQLESVYDAGTYRRFAGERSGVLVIDLADPQWANVTRSK